jgi:hypothetical protein
MSPPVRPELPGATPPPTNIEDILAHQANDAISKGADPGAVTSRLGQSIRWLRANPDVVNQAHGAIAQGADPVAVTGRIWQTAQKAPTIPEAPGRDVGAPSGSSGNITLGQNDAQGNAPQQPGFLQRAETGIKNTVGQIVHHPIDSAESLITAPFHSAAAAFDTPVVGENVSPARANFGKGGNLGGASSYRAPPHGTITTANTPNAETPSDLNAGAIQTAVNVGTGGVAGKVAEAAAPYIGPLLSRVAGSAATGATVGAAYNPTDPGVGAVTGGVVGAALHPVGAAIEGGVKRILPAAINPENAVSAKASRIILNKLDQDNVTPHDVGASIADANGKPVGVADVAGPNTRELMATASRVPSQGKTQILDAVEQRQQGQLGRMKGDVEDALGLQGQDVHDVADAIVKRRSATAAPLYDQFRQSGNLDPSTPELQPLLKSPIIQRAISQARELPEYQGLPDASPAILDKVYKNIGGKAQAAVRAGDGALSHDYNGLRDQLKQAIVAQRPVYGDALDAFAGPSELKTALENGQDFLKQDPRLTARTLKALSPGEQEMYRIGALDNVRRTMESAADGSDLVKKIFGNTERRAQLQSLIGDPAAFEKLQQALGVESQMNRTRNTIAGNSSTDTRRLASDEFANMAGGGSVGENAAAFVKHPISTVIGKGIDFANRARQGVIGKTAAEVGRQLSAGVSGNSAEVQEVVQQLIDAAQKKGPGRLITPRAAGTSQASQQP